MKTFLIVAAILACVFVVAIVLSRLKSSTMQNAKSPPPTGNVKTIDPSQLLYSLPTICDRMAPLEPAQKPPTSDDLAFHEDDWRQIEFVPLADSEYIAAKLADLRQFKTAHQSGPGWTSTYVRPDHQTGFQTLALKFSDLCDAVSVKPRDLYIFQSSKESSQHVPGGFSFHFDGDLSLYGFQVNGIVYALGIEMSPPKEKNRNSDAIMTVLRQIRKLSALQIVDWYRCTAVPLDSPAKLKAWLDD